MFQFKQYNWKRINVSLVITVMILCMVSAYIVRCAADKQFKSSYFRGQIIAMIAGLLIIVVVSLIDYHFICRFVPVFYAATTIMCAATKFSPLGTDLDTNSWRWLKVGFNLQPSELAKIALILTLAVYFSSRREKMDKLSTLVLAGVLTMLPTMFIMVQSDLSSSMVMLFIFVVLTYASGLSYKIIGAIAAVVVPVGGALLWYIQQPWQNLLKGYQYKRVMSFLDPGKYALGEAYQQIGSISAIGSGRLLGKIFTDSTGNRNYVKVDVRESDFIFTVIGEELGFIGSCIVLLLLAIVIIKCLIAAKKAKDYLGRMVALGIASMFMFQIFANVGVATRLLPNTGLPLPFLSRGMSSMLSCMIGIGIIINIGLQSGNGSRSGFSMNDYN